MCLKKQIHSLLRVLRHIFEQIPEGKRIEHVAKVQTIGRKYPLETPQQMQKLLNQLEFRLKFLKVTYPNLNFTVPPEQTEQKPKDEDTQTNTQTNTQAINTVEYESSLKPQAAQEKETLTSMSTATTFVWKDGKLIAGKAQERREVDFSNWYIGNTDPEMLKKHKQLLDRQHFKGPHWENKDIPQLTAVAFLETANKFQKIPPYPIANDPSPQEKIVPPQYDEDSRFEVIKR